MHMRVYVSSTFTSDKRVGVLLIHQVIDKYMSWIYAIACFGFICSVVLIRTNMLLQ